MTNMIKKMSKSITKMFKSFSNSKKQKRSFKKSISKRQRGGAVYSFDFKDTIGGLPATVSLNGTADGDCPSGNLSELGMSNYGIATGGKRKHSHSKNSKHSKNSNNNKHNKHTHTKKCNHNKHKKSLTSKYHKKNSNNKHFKRKSNKN
jgi:hypothetical protein